MDIWKLPHFQEWITIQKKAGNALHAARLLWSFRIGKQKQITFAYTLSVDVFIGSENRHKTNEFIISRPDISTVVAYHKNSDLKETEIVLIREFRSAARTDDGFIREVPGGSTWKENEEATAIAAEEFGEETGFNIDASRLRKIGERQLCGTLSTHQAHVYACEMTTEEIEALKSQQARGEHHGVNEDTERTYVEVHRLGDIMDTTSNAVDWSMVGMILSAIK